MSERPATILLDLDDTLLRNDMGTFLPAYFHAIRSWLDEIAPQGDAMAAFFEASQVMRGNDRPDRTLADAFWGRFLARIGRRFTELQPSIDRFYRETYPTLQPLTGPVDGAAAVVQTLRAAGHRLVVATNPLFPASAIRQRVEWADLGLAPEAFALITSFERFHFVKPNPAYYAEILAYLGWPEGPVVMVGNEPVNDIHGAQGLGLATYHVNSVEPSAGSGSPDERHGSGSLPDFPAWLASRREEAILPDFRSVEASMAILASTAAAMQTLSREIDAPLWENASGEGEWTPQQTLSHLKDVEIDVNQGRAESFLAGEPPYIPGVDTDRWYVNGFGELPPLHDIAAEFIESRIRTMEILAEIPRAAWEMPARHSILGPTNLGEIVGIMAGHDRTHLQHILGALVSGTSGG